MKEFTDGDLIDAMSQDEPPTSFKRGPSEILFQIIEGGSYLFEVWDDTAKRRVQLDLEFGEFQHTEGDADIEQESGMLEDAVAGLLEPEHMLVGWWVMEGFTAHYTRGDWGFTDDTADFYCEGVRPATWADLAAHGICKRPWWSWLPSLRAAFLPTDCN